jgi:hypothetical protein
MILAIVVIGGRDPPLSETDAYARRGRRAAHPGTGMLPRKLLLVVTFFINAHLEKIKAISDEEEEVERQRTRVDLRKTSYARSAPPHRFPR